MDAKISVHRSINKLQNFINEFDQVIFYHYIAYMNNPKLERQVQKAINIFNAAKPFLKDVEHDFDKALLSAGSVNDPTNTVPLLRAVYSAEDAADIFVLSKDSELEQKRIDKSDMTSTDIIRYLCCFFCGICGCFSCCCCCLVRDVFIKAAKQFYRRFLFGQQLESSYSSNVFNRKMKKFNEEIKRLEEMNRARTNSDIENNNKATLLSFQNDRDRLSQRQQWERIFYFRLEEETQVVGLQHHINDLVLRLIPQRNQQRCDDDLPVIAVVGEAGSGKTTLARTVYNSIEVKRHFLKRAWVRITSVFNARRVLVDILEQVNPAGRLVDSTLTEDALMWRLIKLLFGTRFLIVLDDVNTPRIWESLRFATLPFSQGGKLIITTCKNAENLTADVTYSTLYMGQLKDEESWKLFLKTVQKEEDELNNRNLMEIKENILNICAGLPSTIVLLGGLLSTKDQTNDEWSRILIRLADKGIMSSSYEDLPSEVKPCFLHMGLFPRGSEIPVRRLIHLWCAEGFATSMETNPEDLAATYLEELVTRNMVQVSWRVDGTPKTCRIPSVLYDFFSSKAENVGFLHRHFWSSHTSQNQRKLAVRRLAAYIVNDYFHSYLHAAGHLQSYIVFDTRLPIIPHRDTKMFVDKIVSKRKFGLLKVLDLEGVFKPKFSLDICKGFRLLRYLGLRSTFLDEFPYVDMFLDLESLDVKRTNIGRLYLSGFRKLQHVYLSRNHIVGLPSSTTLRTLWGLDISNFNNYDIDSMKNLTKLGLKCTSFQISKDIAAYISQLSELQSLKLISIDNGQVSSIKLQGMDKHQKLESLYLLGNLSQSAKDVGFFPPNLRKLTLSLSGLEEDPMPVLEQLPHLNILRLFSSSYKGGLMTCGSKGFPRLRQMKLCKLQVRVWTVKKGAMPCLRELEFRSCENLEMPRGLEYVTTLKEIVLTNMPTTFGAAVEEGFKDRDVFIRNNAWNSIPYPNPN